jgi:alginate O-acetyltransferase complex protein AlgJ
MTTSPPDESPGIRWAKIFLVTIFMVLLWLPTLDTFFHLDQSPAFNEKRLPATWPQRKPGLAGLQQYSGGLEAYFNDHFGFRNQLIHWHFDWQQAVFSMGRHDVVVNGRPDVITGQSIWMFYNEDGMHMAENFQGTRQFSPAALASLQRLHEERRDWLARRGIKYLFVVAPDKQTIYPENVPAWLKSRRQPTKLDQFIGYMREHSTVDVPDLRPALREAKRIAPTYYKTDTHWNAFGSFIASKEIVQALPDKSGNEPLSANSFEFKKTSFEQGDLANMLGMDVRENDLALVPKTNLPPMMETIGHYGNLTPNRSTTNATAQGVCVVFSDSFGPALIPFLGYRFNTVNCFWNPGGFDTNIIARLKPDVVISEIVERHFNESDAGPVDHAR